jgi:nucleotide-binding universal stress UspA family protein
MYSHILVSTDGSKLSHKAIRAAFELASAIGAKVLTHSKIPLLVCR